MDSCADMMFTPGITPGVCVWGGRHGVILATCGTAE